MEEGSPAWDAGIEPGMRIVTVNGVEPRDIIDWRWEADGGWCDLEVFDPTDGSTASCCRRAASAPTRKCASDHGKPCAKCRRHEERFNAWRFASCGYPGYA